ncbi:hypothetical protein [Yimella lutea]|uniref:hypothetical protein n=1 Tax=Yimella lutea TaxID=587872 RepID=UPI00114E641A|nr:hypothetical protein [Yimella lutea]
MGSCTFEAVYTGTADVQAAYLQMVADATSEFGYDAYNGTISTTSSVHLVQHEPMPLADARELSQSRIDNLSKWDDCEAIPLMTETPARWKDVKQRSVTLEVAAAKAGDVEHLRRLALKELGVKESEVVSFRRGSCVASSRTTKAVAPKGKTQTRYYVVATGRFPSPETSSYASQAEARAAAVKLVDSSTWFEGVTYEVVAMTRRIGGDPLVVVSSTTKTAKVECYVETGRLVRKATVTPQRSGTAHICGATPALS